MQKFKNSKIQKFTNLKKINAPSHIWAARPKVQPALLQTGSHPAGSLPKLQISPRWDTRLFIMCNIYSGLGACCASWLGLWPRLFSQGDSTLAASRGLAFGLASSRMYSALAAPRGSAFGLASFLADSIPSKSPAPAFCLAFFSVDSALAAQSRGSASPLSP